MKFIISYGVGVGVMLGISYFYPKFGYVTAAGVGAFGGSIVLYAGVILFAGALCWLLLKSIELFLNGKPSRAPPCGTLRTFYGAAIHYDPCRCKKGTKQI